MTWLPAIPAHSGLIPLSEKWRKVTEISVNDTPPGHFLAENSIKNPSVWQLESNHSLPFGLFRVQGLYQQQPIDWFVKFVTHSQAQRQLQANEVCVFLQTQGVGTVCLLANSPMELPNGVVALATMFKKNRFGEVADLNSLAVAIGGLHQALQLSPFVDSVKRAAKNREQMLVNRWQMIQQLETNQIIPNVPGEVLNILKSSVIDFSCLTQHGQVVHGDLNIGNILFENDSKICFVDFEDTQTAWFSPLVELAFVIERFLLIAESEDKLVAKAISFLKSYPLALHFSSNTILVEILQGLAIRAMLLLVELVYTHQTVADSEWQKFVYLYSLAEQRKPELVSIVATLIEQK